VTNEEKNKVANLLAKAFAPLFNGHFHTQDKNTQFGIIINKKFSTAKGITCINQYIKDPEDINHITNLVLHKLIGEAIPEVDL